jgi:hypothetical protein
MQRHTREKKVISLEKFAKHVGRKVLKFMEVIDPAPHCPQTFSRKLMSESSPRPRSVRSMRPIMAIKDILSGTSTSLLEISY